MGKSCSIAQLIDFQELGINRAYSDHRFRTVVDDLSAEFHSYYVHPQSTNYAQIKFAKISATGAPLPFLSLRWVSWSGYRAESRLSEQKMLSADDAECAEDPQIPDLSKSRVDFQNFACHNDVRILVLQRRTCAEKRG